MNVITLLSIFSISNVIKKKLFGFATMSSDKVVEYLCAFHSVFFLKNEK